MFRSIALLVIFPIAVGVSSVAAQTKKSAAALKSPTASDNSISVNVFMRDGDKNELLLGTRIWPDYPEYTAAALQRYFAAMKAMNPPYKQDDEVAYTWGKKGRATKCSIYLESWEASAKNGTGAIVGCEANGVSNVAVTSTKDPKHGVSPSQDPNHLNDVMDLFKRQADRARNSLSKS